LWRWYCGGIAVSDSLSRASGSVCAARQLLGRGLAVGDGVEPQHLGGDLAIGDRLHLQRVQPQKSAICSKVSAVFSTSQTAVAFGINGARIEVPCDVPIGRAPQTKEPRGIRIDIIGWACREKRASDRRRKEDGR
jgi:hypothetical protein